MLFLSVFELYSRWVPLLKRNSRSLNIHFQDPISPFENNGGPYGFAWTKSMATNPKLREMS